MSYVIDQKAVEMSVDRAVSGWTLSYHHGRNLAEAYVALRAELAALKAQLAEAERERDEAQAGAAALRTLLFRAAMQDWFGEGSHELRGEMDAALESDTGGKAMLERIKSLEAVVSPMVEEAECIEAIAALEPCPLSDGNVGDGINQEQDIINTRRQEAHKRAKAALAAYRASKEST